MSRLWMYECNSVNKAAYVTMLHARLSCGNYIPVCMYGCVCVTPAIRTDINQSVLRA